MIAKITDKATPGPYTTDECPEANGFTTIRRANGECNGDTEAQPIATVYREKDARLLAASWEMREALEKAMLVINDFMPNIGRCALQRYDLLNEICIEGPRVLTKVQP